MAPISKQVDIALSRSELLTAIREDYLLSFGLAIVVVLAAITSTVVYAYVRRGHTQRQAPPSRSQIAAPVQLQSEEPLLDPSAQSHDISQQADEDTQLSSVPDLAAVENYVPSTESEAVQLLKHLVDRDPCAMASVPCNIKPSEEVDYSRDLQKHVLKHRTDNPNIPSTIRVQEYFLKQELNPHKRKSQPITAVPFSHVHFVICTKIPGKIVDEQDVLRDLQAIGLTLNSARIGSPRATRYKKCVTFPTIQGLQYMLNKIYQ